MAMPKRPTVRDVATQAGVSIATVSRTLTRPDDVNEKTRKHVQRIIDKVGYRANRAAIHFRQGQSHTLLVLVSDITNPFYAEFFKGVEEEARRNGYVLLIGDTSENAENERVYSDMLLMKQASGLILNTNGFPQDLLPENKGNKYLGPPLVSCYGHKSFELPCVRIDDVLGGRLAGEHLTLLGHQHIAQVSGPLNLQSYRRRDAGFRQALKTAKISLRAEYQIAGDLSTKFGQETAEYLATLDPSPTAVFVHNDETAVGLIHGFRKLDIHVPEDMSIVGYDDMPYASVFNPELTTLHIPRRGWGRLACKMLISLLDPDSCDATTMIIPPRLIARQSTKSITVS